MADFYPPDYSGANITYYYDGYIDRGSFANGGSGGGGGMMMAMGGGGGSMLSMSGSDRQAYLDEMLAMIMPPGLSFTSDSGGRFTADDGGGGLIPGSGGGSGGGGTSVSGTGFYQVVRDGVHLIGISNDMVLSGVVKIPVELGNNYGTLVQMNMTEDDSPIGNSSQSVPNLHPQYLTLDTTAMPNGTHYIYGSARWEDTNGGAWEADSPTFLVTTSNEFTFENWMPMFGEAADTLLLRATSMHVDTDWEIDIYDVSNIYLGSFTGHTTDGDIYVAWNLFDYLGHQHTNAWDTTFNFEISNEYVDPRVPPTYKTKDPWAGTGAWAMACQHAWDDSLDTTSLYDQLNGFVTFGSGNGGLVPTESSDGSPFALTFGSDNPQGDTDWASFKSALTNNLVRNLVYFGRGGQNGLGYNPATTNRYITPAQIGEMLHTIPAGQTNIHRFRFVFVDACSTALGSMPEAFGIPHKENIVFDDFYYSSARPCAYIGWPKDKMIGLLDGRYPNYDHVAYMQDIQYELISNGRGIKDAVTIAARYPNVHGTFGENDLKVFGYWGLQIGAYNN